MTAGLVFLVAAFVVLASAIYGAAYGLVLMVALRLIHAAVPAVPALGFLACWAIGALLASLLSRPKFTVKK
jgi:hypothetical protein